MKLTPCGEGMPTDALRLAVWARVTLPRRLRRFAIHFAVPFRLPTSNDYDRYLDMADRAIGRTVQENVQAVSLHEDLMILAMALTLLKAGDDFIEVEPE